MKKISEIAKSIQSLHKNSEIEKQNLLESIEFMWVNAEVQKKKKNFKYLKAHQTKIFLEFGNCLQVHGLKILKTSSQSKNLCF